jgi:tetratricopeptide (TPR) repeat protein
VARTQRLSEACRHLLTLAACLGDRISFQHLQVISGMSETEVLDALDEGIRHHLLTSDDEAYEFAHSLIRQVFYSELSTVRRQRLHQQIAQTLERLYADRLDAHTLEIAHHLIRAGSTADMDKVAHYARLAGDQTYALFAWGESARYYEAVLSADHKTQGLSALDRGHLHYAAGLAHYRHMDIGACRHHYDQVIEAYRAAHDVQGLAQILVEKTRILFSLESIAWGTLIDLQPLEDVFAALGEDDQGLRSSIAGVMAQAYRVGGQPTQAEAYAQQSLDIAQRLGDDALHSRASHVLALVQNQYMNFSGAVENWQRALVYARRTDDLWCRLWPLQRLSLTLMQMAKVDEAESTATEACNLAQELHDWGNHSLALAALVSIAVTRGDFELAEQRGLEIMPLMNRSRYPWGGARALLTLACARLSRGEWGQAENALDMLLEPGRVFEETGAVITTWVRVYRQLLPAHTGLSVDATLEQLAQQVLAVERTDLFNLAPLCALVEIGYLIASPPLVVEPYQRLAQALERGVVFSSWWIFLIPRILGVAATLNSWWHQAEAHFQAATDIALQVGAKPELGRTHLDYARMLVAHNKETNRLRALDLVNQAEFIFSKFGMHAFLLQARQLADTLRAPSVKPIHRVDPPLTTAAHEVPVWLRIAHERTNFLR